MRDDVAGDDSVQSRYVHDRRGSGVGLADVDDAQLVALQVDDGAVECSELALSTAPPGVLGRGKVSPSARDRVRRHDPGMAYDEDLAHRLRELLADEEAITEKKMFGGLAFLLHGHMSVSASRSGGLLVRIDPADTDAALARSHVTRMEMGGRTMDGWIRVAPEALERKRDLAVWVERSVAFVKTLPPK
jgi:TfoX/Sxy family transcriptional regulator of competence genes